MVSAIVWLAVLLAAPAVAQDLPGLVSARLLPGWTDDEGQRFSALELVLQPGWKTYWRNPGDSGIPPLFDWEGSTNMGEVTFFWPRPEVFHAGGARSVGYHDRLVLPFSVALQDADAPGQLQAQVDFGLCREVCVPASVTLEADAPDSRPDPTILAAMEAQPDAGDEEIICKIHPIDDGLRISATVPGRDGDDVVAEFSDPEIWVSEPEVTVNASGLEAVFEAVAPQGTPFTPAPDAIRLTLLGPDTAIEFAPCTQTGPEL